MKQTFAANGRYPFLVVASAGTTDTRVMDPINDIADICEKHDLWFHLDAAYGGFSFWPM
ncbi:MAG: pyridoxal-dependent decarboxylase [Saprospiraceae bacterium]